MSVGDEAGRENAAELLLVVVVNLPALARGTARRSNRGLAL